MMTNKVQRHVLALMNNSVGVTWVCLVWATAIALTEGANTAVAVFFWLSLALVSLVLYRGYLIWNEVTEIEVAE